MRVLNSEVNVHLLSVLSNGNIDQDIHLANIKELQFTLESFLESSTAEQTSEPKYYIVEDPSPEVIKIFGGYLDIPPSFFYAHMADSAMEYTEITGEAEPVFLRDMNVSHFGLDP